MPKTIFLSWQDDTDKKVGHYFLKDVLKEVCEQIRAETSLEEAVRDVRADMDTQGVAGHTFIVPTILEKIDAAAVFVADLTYTGTVADGTKATPNPNVLLEFGWAWKSIRGRIVSVMNTEYGHPKDRPLPFDLGFARWPTFFCLRKDASKKERDAEQQRFVPILKNIVLEILKEAPPVNMAVFASREAVQGIARFRTDAEALGSTWDPGMPAPVRRHREIYLGKGPTLFLRLMPSRPLKDTFSSTALHSCGLRTGRLSLRPICYGEIHSIRADDGIGICGSIDGAGHTTSVAFAFETGELWAVDTSLLGYTAGQEIIPMDAIEKGLSQTFSGFCDLLNSLGVQRPYHWVAGLEGIYGRRLHTSRNEFIQSVGGHPCLANVVTTSGMVSDGQPIEEALTPFFSEVYKRCAHER